MQARLADIAEVRTGFPFRGKVQDDPSGTLAVVQMKDIADVGHLDRSGSLRIQEEPAHSRHLLRQGDVLLQSRGSRFPAAVIDSEVHGIAALGLHVIRPGKDVLPKYLWWVMNHPRMRTTLAGLARGTHIPFLSKADLADVAIPLPPLSTQRKIAEVARLQREAALLTEQLQSLHDLHAATVTWNAATRNRKPSP